MSFTAKINEGGGEADEDFGIEFGDMGDIPGSDNEGAAESAESSDSESDDDWKENQNH